LQIVLRQGVQFQVNQFFSGLARRRPVPGDLVLRCDQVSAARCTRRELARVDHARSAWDPDCRRQGHRAPVPVQADLHAGLDNATFRAE
jgi:hypothetical protein